MKRTVAFTIIIMLYNWNAVVVGAQLTKFQPTWESLNKYQIPNWFRDAKLGIFIHWGVNSVPAFDSEWYPRNMYLKNSNLTILCS